MVALFSRHGRVLRRRKFKTARGKDRFFDDLKQNLGGFSRFKVRAVTVAVPGQIRLEQKNCSVQLGNRDWGWVNLSDVLNKLFDCPIWYENDANLATLYEAYRLPGKTIFLTFSTGIGGGIVERNRILPESNGFEPGHRLYWYGGEIKEWEDIAAASALEKFYHADYATDLRGGEVMREVAKRIYLGLPEIVKKYHPDTIILGGPMGRIFRLYAKYLPDNLGVKYRRPKRPNESVIYGGYLYARQKERG